MQLNCKGIQSVREVLNKQIKFFFVSSGHNSLRPPTPFVTYYAKKKFPPFFFFFFFWGGGAGGIESMIGKMNFTLGPIEKSIFFFTYNDLLVH